jgi:hypothetical protein
MTQGKQRDKHTDAGSHKQQDFQHSVTAVGKIAADQLGLVVDALPRSLVAAIVELRFRGHGFPSET